MPIQVDVYIAGGVASGALTRAAHLRDALESGRTLELERVSWRGLADPAPRPVGTIPFPIDDILVAVARDDPSLPVHATWHAIRLEMGPYVVHGELPTLPGFDPGRALTRPSGEFVMLRDVSLAFVAGATEPIPIGGEASSIATAWTGSPRISCSGSSSPVPRWTASSHRRRPPRTRQYRPPRPDPTRRRTDLRWA